MTVLPWRRRAPSPAPVARCSGAMAAAHDPDAPASEYRIPGRTVAMCPPCADAAGRFGMIDRRM